MQNRFTTGFIQNLISEIWKIFNKTEQIALHMENPCIASYSCGFMGQLYKTQSKYSEAVSLTRRAIFHAQRDIILKFCIYGSGRWENY
ncbi:MAG: hypothetical protein GY795_41375 [Desulfobacterales bacterium]|nr:hypothetical protein [Desulfobacterales bacterium]